MTSATWLPAQQQKHSNLVLAALGVVFGDIGTSPLYTLKECFAGTFAVEPTVDNILGILSLIFWALLIVISLKYVTLIMRADNKGEGGIMALLALIEQKAGVSAAWRAGLVGLALAGASLFYGDGIITPAISVLSAVEGLEVLKPELHSRIIPITLGVLIGLFALQSRGTARVGALFGPIMLLWFGSLALLGLISVLKAPGILAAVNPDYALQFFAAHRGHAFLALGGVVLAITGGEALYADMGHFGRGPIRKAWLLLVLPALLLNYFGQGALLMQNPAAIENPFYRLVPPAGLMFMISLATFATIIASQAVISGAFSLTVQAIQLGFCPRLAILHTSEEEKGQIYVPWINWILMLGVIGLVLGFESSTHLAAAYGIAVTGTMAMTTILAYVVMTRIWKWKLFPSALVTAALLVVDLAFFGANAVKILEGGWFPLVIGSLVFILLTTWKRGRELVLEKLQAESISTDEFLHRIAEHPPLRVPGTAVFLAGNSEGVPHALLNNLRHNKMLHETVILMTVITEPVPRVAPERRRTLRRLGDRFYRLHLHYGFMEQPNIPRVLKSSSREFDIDLKDTTFFLSRENLIAVPTPKLAWWRLLLFIGLARNTSNAAGYFQIPSERVVEVGVQLVL